MGKKSFRMKVFCLLLAAGLLACAASAADGQGEWICANCGYAHNSGNYCSNCGYPYQGDTYSGNGTYDPIGVPAGLLMKLATRSGPATEYDEPGTFFGKNWKTATVRVLGKSWDGNIWWVLVDFRYGSADYRVWTGLKRVNINIDSVPEVYSIGQGTADAAETRRGPGANYAKGPALRSWKDVVVYGRENGWVEVEYEDAGKLYRVWVPEEKAHIDYSGQF